jgi:hypothetical protein
MDVRENWIPILQHFSNRSFGIMKDIDLFTKITHNYLYGRSDIRKKKHCTTMANGKCHIPRLCRFCAMTDAITSRTDIWFAYRTTFLFRCVCVRHRKFCWMLYSTLYNWDYLSVYQSNCAKWIQWKSMSCIWCERNVAKFIRFLVCLWQCNFPNDFVGKFVVFTYPISGCVTCLSLSLCVCRGELSYMATFVTMNHGYWNAF